MPTTGAGVAGAGVAAAGFFEAARLAAALGVAAFGAAAAEAPDEALDEAVDFGAAGFFAAGFLVEGAFAATDAVEELAAFTGAFGFAGAFAFAGALGLATFGPAGLAELRALVVLAFDGARRAVDFGAALREVVAFFGAGSDFAWVKLSATSFTVA